MLNKYTKKNKYKYKKNKKSKKKYNNYPTSHNIYILYTGGTIGMAYDKKEGLIPREGLFEKLFNRLKIKKSIKLQYTIYTLDPVIMILFFQYLKKYDNKDAVYINVSVPCIIINESYLS